jgi:ATP-dependent Clp protease adapter protein ClpS
MPATITEPLLHTEHERDLGGDRGWKVILFNDDVTPQDVVVYALQRAAALSLEMAEMVVLEVEREGESVVRRGLTEEDALIMCGGLRKWTRIPGVCPGVVCEAVEDDV